MQLVLIRHAIAEPRGRSDDHRRRLTPRGKARFERSVRGLKRLRIELDHVLTSPWKRAMQTADLLDPLTRNHTTTELLVQPPKAALLKEARALEVERVAFVGHEPWMGELCALLLLGDRAYGPRFPFKKGGVAILEGAAEPGACELVAMWTPRSLRAVAV